MRQNIRKYIFIMLFLMSIFIITITGCGKKQNETKDVKITEDFIPITDIEEGRPNIYVIVKSMNSSYWEVVLKGTRQAGLDNNCNIYAAGSNLETEWEVQQKYMELAVESGADAIILGPDNSVKLSSAVEMVHEKGIPVIIVDTIVNSDSYDVCYMTDNLIAGEDAAKEMIRLLHEKGHSDKENVSVAIELGARASQTINERLAGFCQYWTKCAPDNWKIIDEIKCNDGDEDLAAEMSVEFLEEYPEVAGVFGTDNASSMGFSSAILKLDKKDVVMVGFDYSPEVANIVDTGKYNVSIMLQRQYDMGYKGVESALNILDGEEIELKFIDTGVTVLNKDTINSDEIQGIIEKNRGSKDGISKQPEK